MKRDNKIIILLLFLSSSVCCAQSDIETPSYQTYLYYNLSPNDEERPKSNNRSSICFDGSNLISFYYQGNGTFELITKDLNERTFIKDQLINEAVCNAVGRHCSPGGSTIFENQLWISDAYGKKLTALDLTDFSILKQFEFSFEGKGSKSIGGVAHDGTRVWLTVHINDYEKPTSETQLLIKINPESGSEIERYSLPPSDKRDGTNALTFDGTHLVYLKSNTLYHLSLEDGNIVSEENLEDFGRVGGITWAGDELIIQKFKGEVLSYKKE